MGRVTVRLPDKLHSTLRKEAARRSASLNEVIAQETMEAFGSVDDCGTVIDVQGGLKYAGPPTDG